MNAAKQSIIDLLMGIDGVGLKTATKFANQIINFQNFDELKQLAHNIENLQFCEDCLMLVGDEKCKNCEHIKMCKELILTQNYNENLKNQYIFGNLIDPMKNIFPSANQINHLKSIIEKHQIIKVKHTFNKSMNAKLTIKYLEEELKIKINSVTDSKQD